MIQGTHCIHIKIGGLSFSCKTQFCIYNPCKLIDFIYLIQCKWFRETRCRPSHHTVLRPWQEWLREPSSMECPQTNWLEKPSRQTQNQLKIITFNSLSHSITTNGSYPIWLFHFLLKGCCQLWHHDESDPVSVSNLTLEVHLDKWQLFLLPSKAFYELFTNNLKINTPSTLKTMKVEVPKIEVTLHHYYWIFYIKASVA